VQKAALYGEGEFDPSALVGPQPAAFNGNGGNGHGSNGNGWRRGAAKNQTAPPATPAVPGPLRIVLEETDDAEGDHERLRALVDTLRGYAGEDEVRLSIRQSDGVEVPLELPPTRACPELSRALGDIIGPWGQVWA